MNNGGIDDGALAQRQAFFLQITIDDRKDCRCELMLRNCSINPTFKSFS
ncbi:Uncharacterised protein [Pseudomonas putida]|nr:Uncharacterised protein [Pseudomonas putida]CAB5589285.1 Uncharacterised protein [Pseudomonas putida]CAB5629352.1 Uncharacterised protein [Pseudomonas putida]CAB5629942.1 Uncharacterised protein [Pseudomonas putida]CAB5706835.1 Uncharacterised protein [Pseudomonas putida]